MGLTGPDGERRPGALQAAVTSTAVNRDFWPVRPIGTLPHTGGVHTPTPWLDSEETVPTPASSARTIRIAIVDDHALFRDGTVSVLEGEADLAVVGQAGTGGEGLALLAHVTPDVAIVDVNLPDLSGLELARKAIERFPGVRILIVSAYDDYAYVTEALEIGVGGYLLKTASGRELVDAVHAVADGVFVLDRAVSTRLARRGRAGVAGEGPEQLTPRELEVLALLARGLSNKQIAHELVLGLRTVESHVSNVLAKLGVASRTEAALRAVEQRLVPPSGEYAESRNQR